MPSDDNRPDDKELEDDGPVEVLDDDDIAVLKSYSSGPYTKEIHDAEADVKELSKEVAALVGITESDTGLAPPNRWDLDADKRALKSEVWIVARCTKIIPPKPSDDDDNDGVALPAMSAAAAAKAGNGRGKSGGKPSMMSLFGPGAKGAEPISTDKDTKYVISLKQSGKFVVGLGQRVSPVDVEEGMRVGVHRSKYSIQIPLPPKIDASVTMMQVEEKPDVTYKDIGGASDQIEKIREVVELPLLHPERYERLGIDPPKGVLLYGPPGTGKTLTARAVANRTDATFIRVIGSELVQKYVGEGARMVRELFQMARSRKACIIFFDEIDAIGGTRFEDSTGEGDVQRTMLELINQLDGFDPRGNIKVIMATNRPDTLDPALMRPGRLDRKIEIGLPDLAGRAQIFGIHTRPMSVAQDIRYELLARLCPNCTGADIHSVCCEAGMFAIRARRKIVTEKDFLDAIEKVVKGYQRFSATPKYMVYN